MTTTTTRIRKRPVPQPVHGSARWLGGNPTADCLADGTALLSITAEGKAPSLFFVETLLDAKGRRLGYRLTKLGERTQYDLDASFGPDPKTWTCDCPDATYTDRPGGCKHKCGLVAALKAANLL